MAHDLYVDLYKEFPTLIVIDNISNAESTHMNKVESLIVKCKIWTIFSRNWIYRRKYG